MGFYGNITNTSKTNFSYDKIYETRTEMDGNANLDGVFLGRYVLVNYDEAPIKAYYDKNNTKQFYSAPDFAPKSLIIGREGAIYQDLHDATEKIKFYEYKIVEEGGERKGKYFEYTSDSDSNSDSNSSITVYHIRLSKDVTNYGRGYDSTVWVKRYDTTTDSYKYVMIAELNAVIPTLHLIVDKPTAFPTTPYFDRDTTNIDYYLHM